jgi:hypothetical protein
MGGNRQHRHVVAVAVKQTVDQMQVTRPAGARTDGQFTGELRFGACGKGGNLFMAGWHPFNGFHLVEAVAESVQGIAGDAPDTFYASLFKRFCYVCSHGLFHGVLLLFVISLTSLEESLRIAQIPLIKGCFSLRDYSA